MEDISGFFEISIVVDKGFRLVGEDSFHVGILPDADINDARQYRILNSSAFRLNIMRERLIAAGAVQVSQIRRSNE